MNHLSKTLFSAVPRALAARAVTSSHIVASSRTALPLTNQVRNSSTEEREPTFVEYLKTFPQWDTFKEWYIDVAGYRKLGLLYDDLKAEDFPEVALAVSRLSEKEAIARIFRIKRAADLSMKQQLLPADEWTTKEQDVRYLTPIIEQIQLESQERKMLDEI